MSFARAGPAGSKIVPPITTAEDSDESETRQINSYGEKNRDHTNFQVPKRKTHYQMAF